MDRLDDVLLRDLHNAGFEAHEAIPASGTLRPMFGGRGEREMLLTRDRTLARFPDGNIGLLIVWTPPLPTKLIGSCRPDQVSILGSGHLLKRRRDRVQVGEVRVWVHRRYRPILQRWTQMSN